MQLENCETGRIRKISIGKLTAEILSAKIVVVRDADATNQTGEMSRTSRIVCTDSLPEHHKQRYIRAHEYVKYMSRHRISKGQRSRIMEAIATLAQARGDSTPPSVSTVMQWMRLYEQSGSNPTSLVPGYVGRRRIRQTAPEIRRVVDCMLRRYYFVRDGSTLRTVHDQVLRELERSANRSPDETAPSISLSTIRRIAHETTPFDRDRIRLGAVQARAKWRFSKPLGYVGRPLERVEMDHTLLDLWVIDDRLGIPLGRPTITLLVCSYSGYIIGFFVSFEGETLARVIRSIKVAIQPKDSIVGQTQLTNPWHAMGLWETLVVDNSLSFHSHHIKQVASDLNFDLEYCPVRMPWFKPSVERHIGSLTRQLPTAGRTRKPGQHAEPYDPRVSACITFNNLCTGILKWIVDVHPFEIHSQKMSRPIDLFLEGLEQCPAPQFPENFANLDVLAGITKSITINHEGAVFNWLRYADDGLARMRREIGAVFKTAMKFDPYDLRSIFVQHPRTREWIVVLARDQEYAAGLSLTQHKIIRAAAKQRLTLANAEGTLRESRLELQDHWQSAVRAGRQIKSGGRQLALFQGLSSTSVHRPIDALQPTRSATLLVPDDAAETPPRPIPKFDTFCGQES
ncbi:transposase [Paraburkholderia sp. SARCC-3016]|uniref:transposase n=1 Tax=Paraburkholderia sp. SARCC-3016 TaxID=3058611 RepID=UPI002808ADC3|nr:transposase [Paraburkholderia sp. SARCC-3016]MDQ7978040.1 transposase [Paraburkholderia sp. SARCC-3016]